MAPTVPCRRPLFVRVRVLWRRVTVASCWALASGSAASCESSSCAPGARRRRRVLDPAIGVSVSLALEGVLFPGEAGQACGGAGQPVGKLTSVLVKGASGVLTCAALSWNDDCGAGWLGGVCPSVGTRVVTGVGSRRAA